MSKWNINWTRSCSDVIAFDFVILSLLLEVTLCKCSSTGKPLDAYNLEVTTPRALVYAGMMTSEDARSWSCSDVIAFDFVILSLLLEVALCKCSSTVKPLDAYNLEVTTPRALIYAGMMTSEDARSWISLKSILEVDDLHDTFSLMHGMTHSNMMHGKSFTNSSMVMASSSFSS
nr:hypothetical protein [Tanacetum cinerariifolium]